MTRWRCRICGYIHVGDEPPERCRYCGARREEFYLIKSGDVPGQIWDLDIRSGR